jgi:putative ABC transport system permease protein
MIITESIFITTVSGIFGMVGGIVFLNSIDTGLHQYFITRPEVNIGLAITATIVLIIFGVVAGYIPAKRAAQIKPIIALRDE